MSRCLWGAQKSTEIQYEGRHLFTNEIVEKMKIQLPLLESGMGAVSYYREELEHITGLRGTHQDPGPSFGNLYYRNPFYRKNRPFR